MKFDSVGFDNPTNKNLNIFVFSHNELSDFKKIAVNDFSDLETFYKSLREAKELRAGDKVRTINASCL